MRSFMELQDESSMCSKKLDKAYISEIDKFLHALDIKFTNTPSQQAEIDKHERIERLRDTPTDSKPTHSPIWDDF